MIELGVTFIHFAFLISRNDVEGGYDDDDYDDCHQDGEENNGTKGKTRVRCQ